MVVDDLGPTLVVATSGDLSRPISHVVVMDPAFRGEITAGALVLAIGFQTDGVDLADVCYEARDAGAAAVVIKGTHAVDAGRVAVVVVEPAADWAQLTSLVRTTAFQPPSDEDSLFGLADAIAGLCGGSVVVHDSGWHLLAYSGGQVPDDVRRETILGRRAPTQALERMHAAGVIERILKGEIVHVREEEVAGISERYAAAVRIGGQVLGTIWVMADSETDEEHSLLGLRRAVEVAALPLLRHATAGQVKDAECDAHMESLLAGGRTDLLVAERLGVGATSGFVLAGLRPIGADSADRVTSARRMLALVRTYCVAYRVTSALAAVSDTVYLLFPGADRTARAYVVQVMTDIHSRSQKSAPHRAVVSSAFASLTETAATRFVIDELLALSERRGWSGLADGDAVQASWRLEQFREVALAHPALLQGPVMRLVEHDRTTGGELLQTLRMWFESVGDARTAATRLNLHVNTVRYRLRKAEEVTGISLENPDERLLAELQVRLLLG